MNVVLMTYLLHTCIDNCLLFLDECQGPRVDDVLVRGVSWRLHLNWHHFELFFRRNRGVNCCVSGGLCCIDCHFDILIGYWGGAVLEEAKHWDSVCSVSKVVATSHL